MRPTDHPHERGAPVSDRSPALWSPPAVLIGLLLAVASWHPVLMARSAGLDASWKIALHMATWARFDFGRDIAFTYGPLGFALWPGPFIGASAIVSVAFVAALRIAFCTVLYTTCRRNMPRWAALIAAYLGAQLTSHVDFNQSAHGLAFLGAVLLLRRVPPRPAERWVVIGGGVLAGAMLLAKVDSGVEMVVIGLVVALIESRRRSFLTVLRGLSQYVGSLAITFAVVWLATGGAPANVLSYAHRSISLAAGFSSAQFLESPGRHLDYLLALALITTLGAASLIGTKGWPVVERWGFGALAAVLAFFEFKESFVRHDTGHAVRFFVVLPLILAAVTWRREHLTGLSVASLIALVIAQGVLSSDLFGNPNRSFRTALSEARTLQARSTRARMTDEAKSRVRSDLRVDHKTLDDIAGRTVHIEPWEIDVAWAYPGVKWRPLPVFQSFLAYSPYLDRTNAVALASAALAPSRILRQAPAPLDGANPTFQSPEATLEMLCRYRELRATRQWQVLGRVQNRCTKARRLSSINVRAGEVVHVPVEHRRNRLVFARLTLHTSLRERLKTLVFKATQTSITLNDERTYRLIRATASGPLLMRVPASVGYSYLFDFGSPTTTFRLNGASALNYRVTFYSVRVSSGR